MPERDGGQASVATNGKPQPRDGQEEQVDHHNLLPELVSHLRDNRTRLREQWASRIADAHLLSAMTGQEIFTEATSVYDNYVEVLETGSVQELQHYARDLSERIIPRGVETHEVVGIVLLLRDVLARSLFEKYRHDFDLLDRVLDAYEPAANRIANTVAVSFVEQRERTIRRRDVQPGMQLSARCVRGVHFQRDRFVRRRRGIGQQVERDDCTKKSPYDLHGANDGENRRRRE